MSFFHARKTDTDKKMLVSYDTAYSVYFFHLKNILTTEVRATFKKDCWFHIISANTSIILICLPANTIQVYWKRLWYLPYLTWCLKRILLSSFRHPLLGTLILPLLMHSCHTQPTSPCSEHGTSFPHDTAAVTQLHSIVCAQLMTGCCCVFLHFWLFLAEGA